MNLKGIAIASHPPVVIPEVGRGKELLAEKTVRGLKDLALKIAQIAPDTIVCITPHGNVFRDGVSILYDLKLSGDFADFGAPEVYMEKCCDMGLLDEMNRRFGERDCCSLFINPKIAKENDLSMRLDHGVMVPLIYIDKAFPDYKIVHITIGDLSLYELYKMGRILREAIEVNSKKTVILACADLSHVLKNSGPYDYHPMGAVFDEKMRQALTEKNYYDILTMPAGIYEPAEQCGLRPVVMALGATDSINTQSEILAYEAPFGVGYIEGMITFDLSGKDPTNESLLERFDDEKEKAYIMRRKNADDILGLAIDALETWVKGKKALKIKKALKKIEDQGYKERLLEPTGVFITLEKDGLKDTSGELRGCMGTISPVTENLAEEIVRNTIEAAAYDPRFLPVEETELKQIQVVVSIIGEIEEVENTASLDPEKYGLILEKGLHRGVLLPGIDGINTVEEQICAVRRKAGLHETFMEDFEDEEKERLYRFEVEQHR